MEPQLSWERAGRELSSLALAGWAWSWVHAQVWEVWVPLKQPSEVYKQLYKQIWGSEATWELTLEQAVGGFPGEQRRRMLGAGQRRQGWGGCKAPRLWGRGGFRGFREWGVWRKMLAEGCGAGAGREEVFSLLGGSLGLLPEGCQQLLEGF